MKITRLPPERYPELLKFPEMVNALPSPESSIIMVKENEAGEITSFWVAQLVVHIEPVVVGLEDQTSDNRLTFPLLLKHLLSELAGAGIHEFFAFADREDVVDYVIRLGLVPLPYIVFKGTGPNPPSQGA